MKPLGRLATATGSCWDRDLAFLCPCPSLLGPFVKSPPPCLELNYPAPSSKPSLGPRCALLPCAG